MARSPRAFEPGDIYHVFTRGSNRQAVFLYDTDRTDFLDCLSRVVRRHELQLLGYCLMPNHFHLILRTPGSALSEAMKGLNGRYALRFNRRYQRDAHLFKNRFGAVLQESDDQLRWTLRYVVRNPVDIGLCREPAEWPWSSYRACVGLEPAPAYLDVPHVLSYFGDNDTKAMARYRDAVDEDGSPIGV